MKAITTPFPQIIRYEEEKYYTDPVTKTKQPFPSINESPRIALSVVVPAYEEEQRREYDIFNLNLNLIGFNFKYVFFSHILLI